MKMFYIFVFWRLKVLYYRLYNQSKKENYSVLLYETLNNNRIFQQNFWSVFINYVYDDL